ncbi:MAG: ectoine/hydroxyectoine ABC transporter permease subunit EhuD [Desulfotignum sp.]|nr:ectoine/hydroxyectoine ABC transporter permease subunit EhuD [Desulfotignum sp.]MCF8124949.1 ectoine/hydroxyectoine ABC transporter permease subunit EhuD [Desulfotignum sp.]
MFDWKWDFTIAILPRLLEATLNTLLAAGFGYFIALIVGLVLALAQRTPFWLLTCAVREFVEFVRSTPLVLQIFFVFYVGPQFGIRLSPWTAGMIAIGLHYAAYLSEVYRAGLDSVPKGQWEACIALNIGIRRTYYKIIIPQALPTVIPGFGNYLVAILKDTPMLSVIGVTELFHAATSIGAETYRFLEPYTLVGIIFLLISLPLALFVRRFEDWIRSSLGMEKLYAKD